HRANRFNRGGDAPFMKRAVGPSLIVIAVLLIATSFQVIAAPSRDELLDDAEVRSLTTLGQIAGTTQTLWSDDRLAPAFLYFERTRFVTFNVKYDASQA